MYIHLIWTVTVYSACAEANLSPLLLQEAGTQSFKW